MKRVQFIFTSLLLLALLFTQSFASDLHIYTEEYPPYNFWEDNRISGTSTEIVKEVLDKLNLKISPIDFRLVPWARAYDAVLNERNSAVYTIARTAEREKLFTWVCPLACARIGIVARKQDSIVINSLEDLSDFRLGVVREDVGHQMIRKYVANKDLDIANSSEANLLKLQEGRIDLFVYDLKVVDFLLRKIGQDPDNYETVYVLGEMPFCFAFNKDTDKHIIEQFTKAFKEVTEALGLQQCR